MADTPENIEGQSFADVAGVNAIPITPSVVSPAASVTLSQNEVQLFELTASSSTRLNFLVTPLISIYVGTDEDSGYLWAQGSSYIGRATDQLEGDEGTAQDIIIQNDGSTTRQQLAQSFVPSVTAELSGVDVRVLKTTAVNPLVVEIVTDSSGDPTGTVLASSSIPAASVGTSSSWISVSFSPRPTLSSGTTYWLRLSTAFDAGTNHYEWVSSNTDPDDPYSAGHPKYENDLNPGTWFTHTVNSPTNIRDQRFETLVNWGTYPRLEWVYDLHTSDPPNGFHRFVGKFVNEDDADRTYYFRAQLITTTPFRGDFE